MAFCDHLGGGLVRALRWIVGVIVVEAGIVANSVAALVPDMRL